MALLHELYRFKSIDTEVALDVELEEEALQGNYVEGAVICDHDKVFSVFLVFIIQLEVLTNQVLI